MSIVTRRPGETILIGDDIEVTVVAIESNQIRVGIHAPKDVKILRDELLDDESPSPVFCTT
jgi:carbon storage regulator